jgi:3-deoxy-manno-octulosonate cytidylyltransferase (CMP-KDO synthetase)
MRPVLGVIPARLGSTRLPRKPLHRLAGKPLIEWVWRAVVETKLFTSVVIATDSGEIADTVRDFGGEVQMTLASHPTGTDRVAEVSRLPHFAGFEHIVNIQGDEPFVSREHLQTAIELVREKGWEIGTVASPIDSAESWRDPSVVKVVRANDGSALLFSRSAIPCVRDGEPTPAQLASGLFLRHIGIYSYQRDALQAWVAMPEGALERIEMLEQLRPLAGGTRIGVAVVTSAQGGVDTPADAVVAEQRLRQIETGSAAT